MKKLQAGKPDEVIINQAFVRQYFPGEEPIGRHLISMGHQIFTIIGVVARYPLRTCPAFTLHHVLSHWRAL